MTYFILARLATLEALRRNLVRSMGWTERPNAHQCSLRLLRDVLELDIERECAMRVH